MKIPHQKKRKTFSLVWFHTSPQHHLSPLPPSLPRAPPTEEGLAAFFKNPLLLYLLRNPNARRRSTAGLNLCSSGDQSSPTTFLIKINLL